MASIPLLCNICPKRPEFSDISHLLTHVGSKGHLSHYFKAQVRSRQEPAVRQQLDTYDRWYAKYQIEKLLSQRLVLKESKEIKASSRANKRGAPALVSSSVTSKRATRTVNRPLRSTTDTSVGVIDPQLSQDPFLSQKSVTGSPLPARDPQLGELASRHRAYIPQMRHQDSLSPSRTPSLDPCGKDPLRPPTRKWCNGTNSGQQTREQTPSESNYPDPSNLSENSEVRAFHNSSAGFQQTIGNTAIESEAEKYTHDDAGPAQSPVLKGIQWPGMNIFDSASPEAQRKRNQKKTNSIMLQMELNSSAVEPLERIFWPEGELKKERIITGMVESSPIKEDSPRPKRRRQTSSRTVLGNLSTNEQSRAQPPPAAKTTSKVIESREADLGDLSKRHLAMLDFSSYAPEENYCGISVLNDEDLEWRLNAGNPIERNDDFIIFHDEVENEVDEPSQDKGHVSNVMNYPPIPGTHAGSRDAELDFNEFTFTPSPSKSPVSSRSNKPCSTNAPVCDDHLSTIGPLSWMPTSDKENIEPIRDHIGGVNHEVMEGQRERSTQRYFYVSGAHPPQFFDFLPSQMEFGGHANQSFFGSSRNPLVPHGQHPYGPNFEREARIHTLPVFNSLEKSPHKWESMLPDY